MQRKTKGLMLAGCAIALGAWCLVTLRPGGDAAPAGRPGEGGVGASASTSASGRSAAPRPALAGRWRAGTTYVYEVENDRTFAMRGDSLSGEPSALKLSGRLSISVVGPTEGGHLLRLALDDLQPEVNGLAAMTGALGDPDQLTGSFYAVAEPTGRLASFSFPRGLGGAERAALKVLSSALQIVVPDPGAARWHTTEQDATGEYEATYRAAADGLHKVKDRYLRARGPSGLAPIPDPAMYRIVSSNELALDTSGWPSTALEDETITVELGGVRADATSVTKARLAAINETPDLARVAAAEQAGLEPEPDADAAGFASAARRADEGLVDGATYSQLLAELAAGDAKARNRAMARLGALFRLHPEEATGAAASILGDGLIKETAQRLIGALGAAGTAEAQGEFASLLDADKASAALRGSAAMSLGRSNQPTPASMQALARAATSADAGIASTATLGLGNLARRMREQGSGDPSDAIAALVQRLARATDDRERILCLDALGNSGDPRALTAIEPYLAHPDVELRATAVHALRFIAGTGDRIATALRDGSGAVRQAAASALGYQAITPMLQLVTAVLQHDANVATRLALVRSLALRQRQEPALADLLVWAAQHDPSPEVRRTAEGARRTL